MSDNLFSFSKEQLREKFKALKTRENLAKLLLVNDKALRYHLYSQPRSKFYIEFKIPKKTGGERLILAPKSSLKNIQQNLNYLLSAVYQAKPSAHGFVNEKSIITNAKQHVRQKYVLNIDLKDFFPSINFGRVRGLFMAQPYSCTPEIATTLAQICCYENSLPQGAPTSPIISNMICAALDSQLQKLAKKYQCIYTRYADDITFSTSRTKFPPHLAWFSNEAEELVLGRELKSIIEDNGFKINSLKVRLQTKYKRQEVTGLTVNEKLNVKRQYVRQIQAILHAWEKYGLQNAANEFWKKYPKHRFNKEKSAEKFQQVIRSRIDFIGAVKGRDDQVYINLLRWLRKIEPNLVKEESIIPSKVKSNSKDKKISILKPSVWTEGKTDITYLKAALENITELNSRHYPFELLFKDDLDDQKQGSPELLKVCQQFSKSKQLQPIIAIFDRDEPKIIPKVHDNSRGFKEWGNGVYSFVLPIPTHRNDNQYDICIEFYFKDEEIKTKDQDGRRLFLSDEFNHRSRRHLVDRNINTIQNIKSDKIKIIDDGVFDITDNNIALSKNCFSKNILNKANGFSNFSFKEFDSIFETIEKILRHHTELDKNPVV